MSRCVVVIRVSVFIALIIGFSIVPGTAYAGSCLAANAPGCTHGLPTDQYQALLPVMLANPGPGVSPLAPDMDSIQRYTFKDGSQVHAPSTFTGLQITAPLLYPMAWIVSTTRPSAIPGQDSDPTLPKLPRYKPVYIFAIVKAGGWDWFLVGPGMWVHRTAIARLIPAARPAGVQGRWVAVDLFQQVFTAYENDQLVFATLISSGLPSHQTRLGLFHTWSHFETDDMSGAMGTPDYYSLPYVPFVMYFDHQISLHGAYWHDGFGFPHSHGCVNMSLTDAHWLFNWTASNPNMSVLVWRSV